MLFRGMDTYLTRHTPKRSTPHLDLYINTLNTQRELLTDRYINASGTESNLVVLLRKILADADIPALLAKPTDLDCYVDILIYIAPSLNAIFDASTTGLTFQDLLIRRHIPNTTEYLIPVQCQDPMTTLPFDLGWDDWQQVRPLRLVDIDSLELSFNTISDQIIFTTDHPTRAVITIDVVALVLQYINFLRYVSPVLSQADYCHRYVLIHLLQDLQDLWLSNIYTKTLSAAIVKQSLYIPKSDPFYGYKGVEFKSASQELTMMITACQNNAMTPATLVASLPLSMDTIPDYITQLIETTSIEDQRQYQWMEWLRDIRWLELIYNSYQLQPQVTYTQNLVRALRRDLPIFNSQRIWNNVHDRKTSLLIEAQFKSWLQKIE